MVALREGPIGNPARRRCTEVVLLASAASSAEVLGPIRVCELSVCNVGIELRSGPVLVIWGAYGILDFTWQEN